MQLYKSLLVDKSLSLLLQEYIEIEYDIRAIVLGDEVIASMKRKVIKVKILEVMFL